MQRVSKHLRRYFSSANDYRAFNKNKSQVDLISCTEFVDSDSDDKSPELREINKELISKVELFNQMQNSYNLKYNITSDCSMILEPDGLICEGGKCKAVYN